MNQTRLEQAAATSEAMITALGIHVAIQGMRQDLTDAQSPPEVARVILATMLESTAVSLGILGTVGEA
jgi:hypothetical protein